MKRALILFSLLLISMLATAQNVTITGNVTDLGGVVWSSAGVTAEFVPAPGNPNYNSPSCTVTTPVTTSTDTLGNFSFNVCKNDTITPSGSTWRITVCPNATAQCFVTDRAAFTANTNITATLLSAIPAITVNTGGYAAFAIGYDDSEVHPVRIGISYYNVKLQCFRIYDGTTWACGTGGGNGMTGFKQPDGTTLTTLQATVDAACGASPVQGVYIPPTYIGTDTFTNTCATEVFDGRGIGRFRGGELSVTDFGAGTSAGFYTAGSCTAGSANITGVLATKGRLPIIGDTIVAQGCGVAGTNFSCVISNFAGATATCGGGVTASTTVTAGSMLVWGPNVDDTAAFNAAFTNIRSTGGVVKIPPGIYSLSSSVQPAAFSNQSDANRVTIDCLGGGVYINWLGADLGAMFQLGDVTNYSAVTVRGCNFYAGPNARPVAIRGGVDASHAITRVIIEKNYFGANLYKGVELFNSWEDFIHMNRFYSCGTYNGASINYAAIHFSGGVGPVNGTVVSDNTVDCYGLYGIKSDATGSNGNTYKNNLIEGSTNWTLADISLVDNGSYLDMGYSEIGAGIVEVSYRNLVLTGGSNVIRTSYGLCTFFDTTSGANDYTSTRTTGACKSNFFTPSTSISAGAGTWAAGRDVYITYTIKNPTTGIETPYYNSTTVKITNTTLNDRIVFAAPTWTDSTGAWTQYCVYTADVATGAAAPTLPTDNKYNNITYKQKACTAMGVATNIDSASTGSIMQPRWSIEDRAGTGFNVLKGINWKQCTGATCYSDTFINGTIARFYTPNSGGNEAILAAIPLDLNGDNNWSHGHVIVAATDMGRSNNGSTDSLAYPTDFGTSAYVPFQTIIWNRSWAGSSSTPGYNSNIGWICKSNPSCGTNPVNSLDWWRFGFAYQKAHADGPAAPAASTWRVGDLVFNTTPSATNYVFVWMNTVAGTPGTWQPLYLDTIAPTTQTDGATITWALQNQKVANSTVTLGGNRTLNITNPLSGGEYRLRIVQDATGTRTLTLGTGCVWKVANGGAGAITLTAAANSIDILEFYYDGTNCYAKLTPNYN